MLKLKVALVIRRQRQKTGAQELQMDMLNADPTVFDRNEAHTAEAEASPVGL
eukprot:COSAG02_NODE_4613_length_5167_cov_40.171468_6_plen_51_part_01